MGRPPLSDNVHQLRGTRSQVGRSGAAARGAQSPDPTHLTDLAPPEWMPELARAVWNEVAPKLARNHLLTELDTFALERLCVSVARYRQLTVNSEGKLVMHNAETGAYSISPLVTMQQMYANQVDAGLTKFGMTPSDRAKVLVNPQGDLFGHEPDPAARHLR